MFVPIYDTSKNPGNFSVTGTLQPYNINLYAAGTPLIPPDVLLFAGASEKEAGLDTEVVAFYRPIARNRGQVAQAQVIICRNDEPFAELETSDEVCFQVHAFEIIVFRTAEFYGLCNGIDAVSDLPLPG